MWWKKAMKMSEIYLCASQILLATLYDVDTNSHTQNVLFHFIWVNFEWDWRIELTYEILSCSFFLTWIYYREENSVFWRQWYKIKRFIYGLLVKIAYLNFFWMLFEQMSEKYFINNISNRSNISTNNLWHIIKQLLITMKTSNSNNSKVFSYCFL
jgi:hypothetical protein